MSEPTSAAAPAAAPTSRTVTIGDEPRTIERVSSAKAARMLAIVRSAGKAIPAIVHKWGAYQSEYEATHSVVLDRAQALAQFGPRPLVDEEGNLKRDEDGEPIMVPGLLAHLTEADWQATTPPNTYRVPSSPSWAESVPAVLPEVLDLAEEHVYRLLALALIPNSEVKRAWKDGTIADLVDERKDDLMVDSYPEELVELAVVVGELVDQQFRRKASELGDRLGNALRLFGLDPARLRTTTPQTAEQATQTTPEPTSPTPAASTSSTPDSSPNPSTDSPPPTDGASTTSSTPPPTSSASSAPSPDERPTEPEPTRMSSPAEAAA